MSVGRWCCIALEEHERSGGRRWEGRVVNVVGTVEQWCGHRPRREEVLARKTIARVVT